MKPYRKRAKGNWSAGKGQKKVSNRRERQYALEECMQALAEMEYSYRDKYRKPRERNQLARLEYRVAWLEAAQGRYKYPATNNYFRGELAKARKELSAMKRGLH